MTPYLYDDKGGVTKRDTLKGKQKLEVIVVTEDHKANGYEEVDVAQTTRNAAEAIKAFCSAVDTVGSFGDALESIAAKWSSLSEDEKKALARVFSE